MSGYRIRDDEWEEIGKRNPQLPQVWRVAKRGLAERVLLDDSRSVLHQSLSTAVNLKLKTQKV